MPSFTQREFDIFSLNSDIFHSATRQQRGLEPASCQQPARPPGQACDAGAVCALRAQWLLAVVVLALPLVAWLAAGGTAVAGEVLLKDGTRLEGRPVPIRGLSKQAIAQSVGLTTTYPILMVDTGMQRYFVPDHLVAEDGLIAGGLVRTEQFKLPQKRSGGKQMVASLGGLRDVTPFDEFGRRRVTVLTAGGPLHIVQGITELNPHHVTVTGLTHLWEHGLATSSLPPETLHTLLYQAIDEQSPDDRLAVARFYLQAGMFRESARELDSIAADFPELKNRTAEVLRELRQLQGRQIMSELARRREAGQFELASAAARQFPLEGASAEVLREIRELTASSDQARRNLSRAVSLMADLQARIEDAALVARIIPVRSEISRLLDRAALPRLDAFLRLAEDETLSPREKLSLAFSGWMLGSASSLTDLELTLRLWEARRLIQNYLLEPMPLRRTDILTSLSTIEGASPERVLQLIPRLPFHLETPGIQPGVPMEIEIPIRQADGTEETFRYSVVLPPEYSPHHDCPAIVALRPAERSIEQELLWWAGTAEDPGQAQRHGTIVIAPHYADGNLRSWNYNARGHEIVIEALRDARRRFAIDSDRVFLSGHGMGGDAAFDLGMSHPDRFAGVIPIAGISDYYCKWYWENARTLPWYIVAGEIDRDSLARNAREVNRMMRRPEFNLIYCEYSGRGYESFYSEIHNLFDWMSRHRRQRNPTEIDLSVLRPIDGQAWWIHAEGLPPQVIASPVLTPDGDRRTRVSPMTLNARVSPGNTIYIRSGASRHTLWLSPEFVNFDERLAVRSRGRQHFNDFVRPELSAILEDLRLRGDRQNVYQARIIIE